MASYKELLKEYRKLAKRADQRLVRIEAAAHEKQYENIKSWAYKNAMRDIRVYSGKGAKRFNTKPPETLGALQRKVNDINNFLNMKTSTIKGTREVMQKRVDTINKENDTNFTLDDWKKLTDSGILEQLKTNYGSQVSIETIATIKKDKKQLELAMQEAKDRGIDIKDTDAMEELEYDWIVQDVISDLLEEHGIGIIDLM